MEKSQTIEMYGRIHSDICNVPLYLLCGVIIQIKLTKVMQAFFLMSNKADSKVIFQFKKPDYTLNESVRIPLFLPPTMKLY